MDERDGFDERLRSARDRQGMDPVSAKGESGLPSTWGFGLRAGVEIVSALIAGAGLGWLLDRWLGTSPWLLLVFFFVGGAAGVVNLYRLISPRRAR